MASNSPIWRIFHAKQSLVVALGEPCALSGASTVRGGLRHEVACVAVTTL